MAGAPQHPDPRKQAARQGGTWHEEEKTRGAPTSGADPGAAGDAEAKGRPSDDRERTEGAAAAEVRDSGGGGDHAPDPDTPVGGGKGTRSMGGSATEPQPGSQRGPRGPT